jgi:hypothetical protein
MKPIVALLASLIMLVVGPCYAQTSPNGRPSIRLDKSTFAVGEAVFFWVGAGWANKEPIPKEYWNTCRLTITRPDGTDKSIRLGWPLDGPEGSTWIGGCGLGEAAKPGRYLLVMEFAGQKTEPTPLVVESVPEIRQIKATFVFGTTSNVDGNLDTPVILTVRNGTNETLRFPHRDGTNGMVYVSFSKEDGKYSSDRFYPPDQLLDRDDPKASNHTVDNFTWKDARDIPTIILKPGETYTQQLSLHKAIAEANKNWATTGNTSIPPGQYKITFSTTLQVLMGEEGGGFSNVSPVHIPVENAAVCTVAR